MLGPWLEDLDSLEAISQNDDARKIFLRMAAMSHDGRLPNFLAEVARDDELDDATKGQLAELAADRAVPPRGRGLPPQDPARPLARRYTGAPVTGD